MKAKGILAACVLWLSASFVAIAQSSPAPAATKIKYDQSTQIKFTGVVEAIEQRNLEGTCKAPVVFVTVKTEGQSTQLQVGPKWFIDDLTWTFTKGDKLDITGWKVDKDGAIGVVVRKINRGEWSLEPRDDSGAPNWLWMTAPKDSGKCS